MPFSPKRDDVMIGVQALRQKAYAQGNLMSTEQQKVVVEKEAIVIQPASTTVLYVPVYDPMVVYGMWWHSASVPYYWYPPGYVARPGAAFTTGVVIGAALWGGVNWHSHDVNININHYNQFNHTNITKASWEHNAAHRRGVAYRDPTVAQKYHRNQTVDVARREVKAERATDAMRDADRPAAREGPGADTMPRDRPDFDRDGRDRAPDRGRPGRGARD
jgi:hypothetical protein